MPVSLTPRPQPGDLITADWMNRLASASEELYAQMDRLSQRLAALEKGGGKQGPELVPVDPNLFKNFVNKLRVDESILTERDKTKRLERAKAIWLEQRKDIVLDDEVKQSQEITEPEWLLIGTAAGIKPSDVPDALAQSFPTSSFAVTQQFGSTIHELDTFANLSTGVIGFM